MVKGLSITKTCFWQREVPTGLKEEQKPTGFPAGVCITQSR